MQQSSTRGFTLIELLLAITLFSLICVALFSGIHLATNAWRRAEAPVEAALDELAVVNLMRSQLRELHAVVAQERGQPQALFFGTDRAVRFVAPLPAHRGVAGLYVIEYAATESNQLVLRYELYRPDIQIPLSVAELFNEEALPLAAANLKFQYFGVVDERGESAWLDSWAEQKVFPRLVRLDVLNDLGEVVASHAFDIKAQDSRFPRRSRGGKPE